MCCIQHSCQFPPPTPFIELLGFRVFGGAKPADGPAWGDLTDISQTPTLNTLQRESSLLTT